MIRHVVALRLASDDVALCAQQALEIKERLEALLDVDPGIVALDVHFDLGLVEGHWPLILVSDFASLDALEAYQSHPRHRDVLAWMNSGVVSQRAVVDFDVDVHVD